MTPEYDMEILKQKCVELLAAAHAVLGHDITRDLAMRIRHVEREVAEFTALIFPSTTPKGRVPSPEAQAPACATRKGEK